MTEEITAYLCSQDNSGGVVFVDHDSRRGGISIDQDAEEIEVKVVPVTVGADCDFPFDERTVETVIVPDPESIPCQPPCYFYDSEEWISWSRGEENDFPLVTIKHPDHCQLIFTIVFAAGHNTVDDSEEQITIFQGGTIPESKVDAHGGGGSETYTQNQNTVVPGMRLEIHHVFSNGIIMQTFVPDQEYWCTPCLFGGYITGTNGPDDEDRTYNVNVRGFTRVARRLDFIDWEVGDWVFLSPFPISNDCKDKNRDRGNKGPCSSLPNEYVIIPLTIGSFGA